jgi:ABC-type sugar transport system ATPase subunit
MPLSGRMAAENRRSPRSSQASCCLTQAMSQCSGKHHAIRSARRLGVATIFQEVLVAHDLSVVENICAGTDSLWKRSRTFAEARQQSHDLLKRLTGRDIDPDTLVRSLPLSVQQWVVIARALLAKPRLLILDESSAALDLDASTRLHAEVKQLRANGCCIILVTHRIAELVRIADRATVLRDGEVVDELAGSDVNESKLLNAMSTKRIILDTRTDATVRTDRPPGNVVLSAKKLALAPDAPPFDFHLCAGEIIGVAGLDGQGQSDFLRIAAGLRPAQAGTVSVSGRDTVDERLAVAEASSTRIAYISGDRAHEGIFPNLSIFENFALPLYRTWFGEYGWINRAPLQQAFDGEVRRLSIKIGDMSDPITSLSGGNQQKILIGRALAMRPQMIVLDDPARGVDFATKQELYKQLRHFTDQGGAVLYLSSEIEEFFDFADRVAIFRNRTLFRSIPSELFSEHALLAAMFGERDGATPGLETEGIVPAQ